MQKKMCKAMLRQNCSSFSNNEITNTVEMSITNLLSFSVQWSEETALTFLTLFWHHEFSTSDANNPTTAFFESENISLVRIKVQ